MEYYRLLHLEAEPFSTSPDPDAFYYSEGHIECLNRLEIAIRLKRGLNIVYGEVGAGKTTLSRLLLRNLDNAQNICPFLILDSHFDSPQEFLATIYALITGAKPSPQQTRRELLEAIKRVLFHQNLNEGKTPVLIIDEGQKMPTHSLEVIRELLNYETNTEKLLQVVLFGQNELLPIINGLENFRDRINEELYIPPLSAAQTKDLIHWRLFVCGGEQAKALFPDAVCTRIYTYTKGHPRKIITLCHKVMITMLLKKQTQATPRMVKESACAFKKPCAPTTPWYDLVSILIVCLCLLVVAITLADENARVITAELLNYAQNTVRNVFLW